MRTEAKRLRSKLKDYYETEGVDDKVLIYYRSGTYQPVIRASQAINPPAAKSAGSAKHELPGITVAVLPFRHQEGEPVAAAIAAGVTDDLIFLIASTEGCHVLSPQSVALAESHITDVSLLSEVLNVDQIITGSVRKDASRVRVSVTGVHPSGFETWSERFDLTTGDNELILLEEQTALAIMARIAPQKSRVRHKQAGISTASLSAFPEMLTAESALDHGTSSSLYSALARLQRLALRVPESPRIQCGIAQCYYSLAFIGELINTADMHQAKTAAAKALELDPDMGVAHAAMACSLVLKRQLKDAEDHFRHALSLSATPAIRQRYADLLMSEGRFEEASTQLRESRRLDSFSCRQRVSLARFNYLTWHTSRHIDVPQEEVSYGPVPNQALLFQAELLLRMRNTDAATSLAEAILLSSDESTSTLSGVAGIFALAGKTQKAWALIDRFHLLDEQLSLSKTYQARLCVALQDKQGCDSRLRVAVAQKEPQLGWIATDPRFDDLRSTAIYKRAIELFRNSGLCSN